MNQNRFNSDDLELFWQSDTSDVLMQHHLKIKPISTKKGYENLDSLRMRAFCHLLLDYLSEDGLEEVKDFLLEAIKFYRESQAVPVPFHSGESFEVAIGEGYERPIFQIAED